MQTGQIKTMKKLFIALVLTLQMVGCAMAGPAGIQTLVNQYRYREDVDVISVGPMGMSLLRMVAGASSGLDKDVLDLLRLTRDVKRVTIVDFGDSEVRDSMEVSWRGNLKAWNSSWRPRKTERASGFSATMTASAYAISFYTHPTARLS